MARQRLGDVLFRTRREADNGPLSLHIVRNERPESPRRSDELASVARELFHVANEGTFRHLIQGKNVTDLKGRLLAKVTNIPECIPSAATVVTRSFLYRMGLGKWISTSGAPRPHVLCVDTGRSSETAKAHRG
eukprot:TRINITY_DN4824_c0_g1_i1.p2 TRINITY_DN4824_c0_g1~~TRINITY_DN4824_c0_g1_i1.p2  ORF type:complete len:133 (-),score=12.40 TRINITY_DN4824_c0_g1_i1:2-400(-)